jgi:anaerobic selenocysteine-containing dehydrogenase
VAGHRGGRHHAIRARARSKCEVTEEVRPGVVSIPHGWGHDVDGVRTKVATAHAGVNSNLVADETLLDTLSGTAVRNGIPVEVAPA